MVNLGLKQEGAHHFFTFIEEELKPQIEKNFEIDKGKANNIWAFFRWTICFTYIIYKHKCLSKLFY